MQIMKMYYNDDERAALRSVISAWKEEHEPLEFGLAQATVRVEVWRPAVGFEGYYEVSTYGRVKGLERVDSGGYRRQERILKPILMPNGYLKVNLNKDGKEKQFYVHRLVGMVFPDLVGWTEKAKGKPFEELQINHKDQNKQNNHISNLEWCDGSYNLEYGDGRERAGKSRSKTMTGKYNTKLSKPVAQKTKDGELIKVWPSTAEVQRQTGWKNSFISACCLGKCKSAYGYVWSYINVS